MCLGEQSRLQDGIALQRALQMKPPKQTVFRGAERQIDKACGCRQQGSQAARGGCLPRALVAAKQNSKPPIDSSQEQRELHLALSADSGAGIIGRVPETAPRFGSPCSSSGISASTTTPPTPLSVSRPPLS